MALYKYLKGPSGADLTDVILRISDSANIPDDPLNRDWVEYQEWLAQDNTPDPA